MKIAVISNVNMDPVIRILSKSIMVFPNEGYGNELGMLINEKSSLSMYQPDAIFIMTDLVEIIEHIFVIDLAREKIDQWFEMFERCINERVVYFLADAYLRGNEKNVLVDGSFKYQVEYYWLSKIINLTKKKDNIRIFPFREQIEKIGYINAYSSQMWYMGRIPYSVPLQKAIAEKVLESVKIETMLTKKVLLLDLDNTLWGGLAGENDHEPIVLSDDHLGLVYKDLQRVILEMKKQGVLLGIVSKNNEEDALEIIHHHPHMVLREEDFAIKKINWNTKDVSIKEIAEELNLGLDSIVFFDDNPAERELVRTALPTVVVCDFPQNITDLPKIMVDVWKNYFAKPFLTIEDREKTTQYHAQKKREDYKNSVDKFLDYLEGLQIRLIRKNEINYEERILQLLNKTNQFNLTTRRYTKSELNKVMRDSKKRFFVYQVVDKFGDEGIIAVVIVDLAGEKPIVSDFVMSCRTMGKNIENAILDQIEKEMIADGYEYLNALYCETVKNQPVKEFYEKLHYKVINKNNRDKKYELELKEKPVRKYVVEYEDEKGKEHERENHSTY